MNTDPKAFAALVSEMMKAQDAQERYGLRPGYETDPEERKRLSTERSRLEDEVTAHIYEILYPGLKGISKT